MKQLDGIIILNKPTGLSSAQCLAKIKRLGQKKIGHAGTLDPLASGVLIVLLGQATKLSNYFLEAGEKVYQAVIRLGQVSDTLDVDGTILEDKPFEHITYEMLENEINSWLSLTSQEVPAISAAKHNGTCLYKLARQGKETPIKFKDIKISHVELQSVELPYVQFEVRTSSGTYIRSLAHSLGCRLECGAILTALVRKYSYPFYLEQAHSLEEILNIGEELDKMIVPLHLALPNFQLVNLNVDAEEAVKLGKSLDPSILGIRNTQNRYFLQSTSGEALALAHLKEIDGQERLAILRGLWSAK